MGEAGRLIVSERVAQDQLASPSTRHVIERKCAVLFLSFIPPLFIGQKDLDETNETTS